MKPSSSAPVIAIAPDSFKGALDALGVAKAIASGLGEVLPDASFRLIPMADGGEGSAGAWADAVGAEIVTTGAADPLGRPIEASFAFSEVDSTAVIEMAAASGLPLLALSERNPLLASTAGTGDLIRKALDLGARKIVLCIGGSATNDAGTGMATALGARFLDSNGHPLPPGGSALADLASIDLSGLDPRLDETAIEVACDVTNPLCGPSGASCVYGPQKGASEADVARLDAALAHLATIAEKELGVPADLACRPGSGAAGGLGYGLAAFLGATFRRGVEMIADEVGLADKLAGCDLVITGEGRIDSQTVNGKTPAGVAAVAKKRDLPVIAICGCVGTGYEAVHGIGIDAVCPVAHGFFDPADPSKGAVERIRACAAEVGRMLALKTR